MLNQKNALGRFIFGFVIIMCLSLNLANANKYCKQMVKIGKKIDKQLKKSVFQQTPINNQYNSNQDPSPFSFKVASNNFVLATPTWGPGFIITMSVVFDDLPGEHDKAQNLVEFFSADKRFENIPNGGRSLPTIQVLYIKGSPTLGIQISLGLSNQTKDLFFPNLEKGRTYDIVIKMTPTTEVDRFHAKAKFTVEVNNFPAQPEHPSDPNEITIDVPASYTNLGIFAGNGDNFAKATISDLKIGNLFTPTDFGKVKKAGDQGTVLSTAATWTDVYQTAMDLSVEKLPDQTDNIANLFKLIDDKNENPVLNAFNTDLSDFVDEHSKLPSVNVKTSNDGNHWCMYKNGESTDCDLSLKIPENFSGSATVTLKQLIGKDETGLFDEHHLSCHVNDVPLKTSDGKNFVVVNNADTYQNVKYILAGKSRDKGKVASNRGLFDFIGKVVNVVTTVGTIGTQVLSAV